MAKQLNLLAGGQIIPTPLHTEMQRSYLEYAMSVIVGRALPDVRDGLKPVHRRIIYAMHELGLTPDRPYRKCARVVGDVLGKYHPHGDQAVYDALVRMVQDFSSRYPLLAGHGNFGSVDNDPAAAMRYTETRLSPISHEGLLSEIGEATVDFIGNFDNSQQEPTVLPAQLPILLLNGSSGIAVGMATNIPPHNLGEVVDGLVALIDKPDLSDQKLWELIPGPDFPTGGEILGIEGIREAYTTGRGSIPLRGVVSIDDGESEFSRSTTKSKRSRQRRTAMVVTELPFQVNKAAWIEKVAELVNHGKIEGIADLRDESDREGMRVVIELKRDTNPNTVLEQLYRQTALQSNFGAILLALVDGQPRQLTLRQMLQEFLNFREQTLTKQYNYELEQAQKRVHLVEGLLLALSQLDPIIDLLRNAPDGTTAKVTLQNQFNFSDTQTDAILSMPMRRLTGLERKNLQAEFDELSKRIELLKRLLSDRQELLKNLKKDLKAIKRKYADPRRTKIIVNNQKPPVTSAKIQQQEVSSDLDSKRRKSTATTKTKASKIDESSAQLEIINTEPPETEVVLEFTQKGYVRRLPKNGGKTATAKASNDFVTNTNIIGSQAELVVLTSSGKAYPVRVRDIPPTSSNSRGTPLITLLPAASENIIKHFFLSDAPTDANLVLLTQKGQIKRLEASELKQDDQLSFVNFTKEREQVVLATSGGRLLRFLVNDQQLPVMGRTAQGLQALRLGRAEHLVSAMSVSINDNLLLVSQLGYGKRLPINALRLANRADIGTQSLQFTSKQDALAGVVLVQPASEVVLITSTQRYLRLNVEEVPFWGKDGTGDRIIQLNSDEKVISLAISN
jgi:DNA gyrase subunit A